MITDYLDKRLLRRLRANSREPISRLSRSLGVSRSTVKDRIERLEKHGVIKGYSLELGEEAAKGYITAHVMINIASHQLTQTMIELQKIDEITKVYGVSGSYDLIVMLEAESTDDLDPVLDTIRDLEGVKEALTSVVLSTKFER